jgi:hypothetical protein
MKLFSSSSLLYITITITTAAVTVPTIMFLLSSSTLVSAFSPPSLLPSMPFKTSSSSSSSRSSSLTKLNLSDNLKDYRRGLSQIHKNGGDDRDLQNVDPNNNNNKKKQKLIKTVECVFKFGGSSIATAERIDHVANLIKDQIELGYKPRAVICSAMGKTTNNLLSAGEFALGTLLCCCTEEMKEETLLRFDSIQIRIFIFLVLFQCLWWCVPLCIIVFQKQKTKKTFS